MSHPKRPSITIASAIGCFALAAASADAALITTGDGLTATASTFFNSSALPAVKTVNGNGLTGNQHTNGTQAGWLSDGADLPNDWIQFDLGDTYNLSSVQVWNWNQTASSASWLNASIQQLDIYVSALSNPGDPEGAGAANWTLLANNATFTKAPGTTTYTGFDLATEIGVALPLTGVRYVRFEIDSNYPSPPNGTSVGLSEIQFNGTLIPEPSSSMLFIAALATLSLRRKRVA